MRKPAALVLFAMVGLCLGGAAALSAGEASPEWSFNGTAIEACSCPMFCQCYFNPAPAAHHGDHGAHQFCKANLAYKINKGHYGDVKLDGAKFWLVNDLGSDFSKGKMDWVVVYFDKGTTMPQRKGIEAIFKHLFPVEWRSYATAEAAIDTWEITKDGAVAKMDGGRTAEVRLKRYQGMTDDPIVIHNLRYWGAPRNDGFILMPNEIEAYRVGDKAFEFKGTNGFLITVDMSSKDAAKASGY